MYEWNKSSPRHEEDLKSSIAAEAPEWLPLMAHQGEENLQQLKPGWKICRQIAVQIYGQAFWCAIPQTQLLSVVSGRPLKFFKGQACYARKSLLCSSKAKFRRRKSGIRQCRHRVLHKFQYFIPCMAEIMAPFNAFIVDALAVCTLPSALLLIVAASRTISPKQNLADMLVGYAHKLSAVGKARNRCAKYILVQYLLQELLEKQDEVLHMNTACIPRQHELCPKCFTTVSFVMEPLSLTDAVLFILPTAVIRRTTLCQSRCAMIGELIIYKTESFSTLFGEYWWGRSGLCLVHNSIICTWVSSFLF